MSACGGDNEDVLFNNPAFWPWIPVDVHQDRNLQTGVFWATKKRRNIHFLILIPMVYLGKISLSFKEHIYENITCDSNSNC